MLFLGPGTYFNESGPTFHAIWRNGCPKALIMSRNSSRTLSEHVFLKCLLQIVVNLCISRAWDPLHWIGIEFLIDFDVANKEMRAIQSEIHHFRKANSFF